MSFLVKAQQHSVTLSLGTATGSDTNFGRGFGANYAYRLRDGQLAALFVEVPFWANPNRTVSLRAPAAASDVASLFLTPGLRVSFLPKNRISPFVAAGGGLAVYEHSSLLQNGRPYPGDRVQKTGAFEYGGGVDVRVRPWLAFRGEVRDFYTGAPQYGVPVGNAHNPLLGIGVQLRFR